MEDKYFIENISLKILSETGTQSNLKFFGGDSFILFFDLVLSLSQLSLTIFFGLDGVEPSVFSGVFEDNLKESDLVI